MYMLFKCTVRLLLYNVVFCAEIIKYLEGHCKEDCAHIHILPVYHLSLGAHNSHHGSFGRGISDRQIDCRSVIASFNFFSCLAEDVLHRCACLKIKISP